MLIAERLGHLRTEFQRRLWMTVGIPFSFIICFLPKCVHF